MKRLYALAILLISGFALNAQNLGVTWARSIGGTGNERLQFITTDAAGNVYVAGAFEATVDFDPSATTLNLVSAGQSDAFFAKYSSAGALVWAKQLGSTGQDEIYGITVDGSGNVYVAGYFSNTVDFNPDAAITNRTSGGLQDGFYGKYTSTGAFTWVNQFGSSGNDYAYNVAVDAGSNVYVAGVFTGTVDFDPSGATLNKTFVGGDDAFFGKYTSTGALSWVNHLGSTGGDFVGAISISGTTAWIGGYYGGAININPNGTSTIAGYFGGFDGLFASYSTSSGLLGAWGTIQGSGNEKVNAIHFDGGNVYTAGEFEGNASIFGAEGSVPITSAGVANGFFAHHTSSIMDLRFVNVIGGTLSTRINHMVVDPAAANIYLTGLFMGTADFDPDSGTTNLTTVNSALDGFIAKYSKSDGTILFAHGWGSTGSDQGSSVAVDASNNVYVGGVFEGTVDFAPGTATANQTSKGFWDGSFIKYAPVSLATEPTAQPTNLVISNPTGYGFDWNFTPATGAPAGYLGIYKIGSAPTAIPQDGVTYEDAIGDAFVLHSGTGTSWTWSGAQSNANYHLAIFAYNGSGSSINYRTVSPATGNVTTLTASSEPANAPTNFATSSVSANALTVSFNAASGATGYIAIRNIGSEPLAFPADGRTYTVGENITNEEVVAYVGSATTFAQTGLLSDTEYHYSIYAYNGTSTSTNYRTTSWLDGSVFTLEGADDVTSPIISNSGTATTTTPNTDVVVKLVITDSESGVGDVEVHYYPINSYDYGEGFAERKTGNNFEYTIPASFVREQGVEYEVVAYDMAGNPAYINFTQVLVEHKDEGLTIPYNSPGKSSTNYRIVSVPLNLTKKSVGDVFSDDLGPADKSKWRLFHYSAGSTKEQSGNIELGKGYWLISSEQKTIDSGPGTTADVGIGKPFTISLTNGWNQIGNPFNFNVAWEDIVNDSENDEVEVGNLRVYNGAATTPWSNGATLTKMSGGFIMAAAAGQLYIPVATSSRTMPKPKPNFAQPLGSATWAVDLKLKAGDFSSEFGGIGMHTTAKADHDKHDDYTLPRFNDYLELNHHKKLHGSPFTRDIVPTANEHIWTFDIESNIPGDVIELSWDNATFGDSDYQLVLWDDAEQRAIDMRRATSYSFDRGKSNAFRILFGGSEFIADHTMPARMVFHSASPVPATDRVTFAFSVPETANRLPTSLDVYNLMGQRVARIVEESLSAGYHEATWMIEEGRKPARGVYISVLKFGETVSQKRIVLK
jgi:hypothetical protein